MSRGQGANVGEMPKLDVTKNGLCARGNSADFNRGRLQKFAGLRKRTSLTE